jgi:hypothetical protein
MTLEIPASARRMLLSRSAGPADVVEVQPDPSKVISF